MYVFQQVYPLYSVLVILAITGFPIAISKMISEKIAIGDQQGVNQIHRVAAYLLTAMGIGLFLLLFFGAHVVAGWMGNSQMLTLPIQAVSFALLIVPLMAAFRGLFQGDQDMKPSGISQVVEQIIRVATILVLSWYAMDTGLGVVYAGAGATFGAFTGAIGGLIVLIWFWRKSTPQPIRLADNRPKISNRTVIKQLFLISLPICLGSLTMPLYALVDSFSVANVLTAGKYTLQQSVLLKGAYDRGQPLLQFAAIFSTVLSLSVVPAIAKASMSKDRASVQQLANLSVRFTWMLGLPASVGLAIVALPTNIMLFKNAAGSLSLMILACGTIFLTLSMTIAGILQGLGRYYTPAVYLLVGIAVKIGANALLIPILDIRGAALATLLAYIVHAGLSLYALQKLRVLSSNAEFFKRIWWVIFGMAVVTICVMLGLQWVTSMLQPRLQMSIVSLGSVVSGAGVYLFLLFRYQVLTREDLKQVPKLEKKLVPLLEKWRFLRR